MTVRTRRAAIAMLVVASLSGCASVATGDVSSERGLPSASGEPFQRGIASWYGLPFHGRRTASGERFDMNAMTAAHPTLPFGTRVKVRSTGDGREVVVRINDRGPHTRGRIIDLSHAAARQIGLLARGAKEVTLTLVD